MADDSDEEEEEEVAPPSQPSKSQIAEKKPKAKGASVTTANSKVKAVPIVIDDDDETAGGDGVSRPPNTPSANAVDREDTDTDESESDEADDTTARLDLPDGYMRKILAYIREKDMTVYWDTDLSRFVYRIAKDNGDLGKKVFTTSWIDYQLSSRYNKDMKKHKFIISKPEDYSTQGITIDPASLEKKRQPANKKGGKVTPGKPYEEGSRIKLAIVGDPDSSIYLSIHTRQLTAAGYTCPYCSDARPKSNPSDFQNHIRAHYRAAVICGVCKDAWVLSREALVKKHGEGVCNKDKE